jgi:DNA-directed RNA polymerase subunit RPC12/RpoP
VKRVDPRRVKLHRNYTVEEAAMVTKVHKNTVRGWLKSGLETIDTRRPTLVLGRKLSAFLHARRQFARQRCRPGQFYCLRCRAPKEPASRKADYVPITSTSGNLKGRCPDCGSRICRRVVLRKLAASAGDLQVQLPQAQQRIEDTSCPSLNSDLSHEADPYANAHSGK